jgi:biopolymer transport protein ExbB
MFMMRFLLSLLLCCIVAVSTLRAQEEELVFDGIRETVPAVAAAQPKPDAAPPQDVSKKSISLWSLIQKSGIIGYVIILMSLLAVALMIEYAMSIRRTVLMPQGFADDVLKLLTQGQPSMAMQKCQSNPSALAQILFAGMAQFEFGWDAVEKSAEEATAEQASRLYRKVEYLHVIGNIAPMLGLLGTVIGMVMAFQQMADSAGYGRAAELAEGIYLALITTIQGLSVAIPCLAVHSFFANRIATLISETTFAAEQVLQPIKKNLLRKINQSRNL